MCFDPDARPPIPPIAGGAAEAGDRTLTSADGTRVAAYSARAAQPSGAGMIVLPDVRGLHAYYKELTQRFAEAGVDAVTIDYFARTAGLGDRGEGFDVMAHLPQTRPTSRPPRLFCARRRAAPSAGSTRWASASAGRWRSCRRRAGSATADAWRRVQAFIGARG